MRTFLLAFAGVALGLLLVAGGLAVGFGLTHNWASPATGMGARGWAPMMFGGQAGAGDNMPCVDGGARPGRMGWRSGGLAFNRFGCSVPDAAGGWRGNGAQCGPAGSQPGTAALCGAVNDTAGAGPITTLAQAQAAIDGYIDELGTANLAVDEVMEFADNFYAIVVETDSGIGAMELLVDRETGAVGPEHGPNMMWNTKYGMMAQRARMGGYALNSPQISAEEAAQIAQDWLDGNYPGRTAGTPDAFYGYYTLHFLQDGQIEGMLSVNDSSGRVWYHNWHGEFIAMVEGHGE